MAPSPKPGGLSIRPTKKSFVLKANLEKRVAELEAENEVLRKQKLPTPRKVLKVSCGKGGQSTGVVDVAVGEVDPSAQTGSTVLACVEVAVGPVFVDGSTQTDFSVATCVEVAVGPDFVFDSAQTDSMAASCVDTVVGSACVDAAASGGGWSVQRKKGSRSHRGSSGPARDNASSITIGNRFSALGDPSTSVFEIDSLAPDVHLLGDSIVRNVRVGKPGKATTWCYPGTRVEHLTTRVKTVLLKASKNPVVVLHAGTNNIGMDSPRGVAERLRHLTMEVRRVRPGARIVLSAILPRFARRPGVMDRFNSEVRQISRDVFHLCRHEGFAFVDATQELLRDPVRYYLRDGLHLTSEGKQVLSTIMAKAVLGLGQGNW